MARVLVIARQFARKQQTVQALRGDDFDVVVASRVASLSDDMRHHQPDLVVLDAISLKTSGIRFIQHIRELDKGVPLLAICDDRCPYKNLLQKGQIVVQPLSARKIMNRVNRLLPVRPDDELTAGPLRLDPEHRRVRCHGCSSLLTPKGFSMLMLLARNKGKVVSRERLMKHVWHTDYTGDTRTLDVHASWLRRAIEKDPACPKLLKTIRGVGYRLDVD